MQAFSAAGQEMYQAQAAEAGAEGMPDMEDMADMGADADAGEPAEEAPVEDEDVVEADYEIVDEEK